MNKPLALEIILHQADTWASFLQNIYTGVNLSLNMSMNIVNALADIHPQLPEIGGDFHLMPVIALVNNVVRLLTVFINVDVFQYIMHYYPYPDAIEQFAYEDNLRRFMRVYEDAATSINNIMRELFQYRANNPMTGFNFNFERLQVILELRESVRQLSEAMQISANQFWNLGEPLHSVHYEFRNIARDLNDSYNDLADLADMLEREINIYYLELLTHHLLSFQNWD